MGNPIEDQPWDGEEDYWDRLTLNDREWPGLARVSVKRKNKWDTKKSKGKHGGTREFAGADLAHVRIELRVWTREDWDTLTTELLQTIEPDPGKKFPETLAIQHPVTSARNCPVVTVDEIDGPSISNDGVMTLVIEATEFREPDKKNATGQAGGVAVGKGRTCAAYAAAYSDAAAKLASAQNDEHGLGARMRTAQLQKAKLTNAGTTTDFTDSEIATLQSQIAQNQLTQNTQRAIMQGALARMQENGCPTPPSVAAGGP